MGYTTKPVYATLVMCLCFCAGHAQRQLWFDYQLDYPFASQYLFEMTTSYQTIVSNEDKWRNLTVTPTLEYQFFTRLDILFSVPLGYTAQTDDYDSFEATPTAGVRLHITQNKRVDSRLVYKLEERLFFDMEESDWQFSNRSRLKAEALISINGPNRYQDKLWHAIVDYEEFFVADQQVEERFANRRRGRLGVGYRHTYKHRFELIYALQSSRNEIEDEFGNIDHIVQLRYKMFLNPARPSTDN